LIGADEIYLLSHKSDVVPNKNKIDLNGSLYGIEQDKIIDDIYQIHHHLLGVKSCWNLLMIVRFLITHAHPFRVCHRFSYEDGSNINNLLNELSLAAKKILNKKIRMN
jgi:hypothetical protein